METPKVLSKTAQQLIEDDQKKSHAVFFVDCPTDDELLVEDEIEHGLQGLQDRSAAAGMEMLGPPAILQSTYYNEGDKSGHLAITVICSWMSRETLEKIRLQQHLAGAPPNGVPPRNPMRRA